MLDVPQSLPRQRHPGPWPGCRLFLRAYASITRSSPPHWRGRGQSSFLQSVELLFALCDAVVLAVCRHCLPGASVQAHSRI